MTDRRVGTSGSDDLREDAIVADGLKLYRTPDLGQLFDRRFVTRLDRGSDAAEIDP